MMFYYISISLWFPLSYRFSRPSSQPQAQAGKRRECGVWKAIQKVEIYLLRLGGVASLGVSHFGVGRLDFGHDAVVCVLGVDAIVKLLVQ